MTSAPIPLTRERPRSERFIETLLFLAAALGVLTTAGIVLVLVFQTLEFFQVVSPVEFSILNTELSRRCEPERRPRLVLDKQFISPKLATSIWQFMLTEHSPAAVEFGTGGSRTELAEIPIPQA